MDELSIEDMFRKTIKDESLDVYRGVVKRKHIQRDWKDKKDFYYVDTGYFGNFISPGNPGGKKLFHRIVKNDLQKHWLENHPSDRWEEICKIDPRCQWKGWKKNGKKILVIVPNRKSCVFYGYEEGKMKDRDESKPTWLMNTIDTIKKHTDMEIVIREKGSRSARQHHSIFDALDEGIFATVAFNSIAALESVVYGIPAFVTVPCAASPLASTNLSQLSTPFYPDESLVQQHCASLAYGQFTGEEITNGTAWKLLNK
jgi:hypothetical protein